MERSSGGAALVLKAALCLFAGAIAIFFVVQASLGAREAVINPPVTRETAPGEALYDSLGAFLDIVASTRVLPLATRWELDAGGEIFLEEEGGVLYLTSNQGQVLAVDAASGRTIWQLDLGVWVSAPPAVDSGVVYVGATDHVLYSLDAGSGALLWYYTAQGEILAQPVVNGDMVFFTADNDSIYDLLHRLYALDAGSGTPVWIYDTESWTPAPPAVGADAVYLGGYRREVYALDKPTGAELWSFRSSNIVFSSPQIGGGRVLFACIDGWVHALDAVDGSSLWSKKLPGFVWLAPLDGSDNLYACSHGNTLNAMALESGEELWSFTGGDLLSSSTLTDMALVCAFRADGRSYLLDAATGKPLGILEAPYGFASPPLLVGRTIYAGCPDGFVRAYELPDGIR
ncbi:MAG: PQQ-binding-like beta-propeller repeat protein [Actinomycetota bacterium]